MDEVDILTDGINQLKIKNKGTGAVATLNINQN